MSRPRLEARLLATALVLSIALARSGHAAAQSTAACTGPDCADRDRLWVPAGQIHDIKNQFVAGVRQFTEAVAGTFGDEGPKLSASLDVMRRTLAQWDAAIRAYETMVAALPGSDVSAESKVALGTVYLDRDRRDDALREFAAAARLDPRRADAHSLSGVAYGLNGKPAEAIEAFRRALALDPGNTLTLYALAQQLSKTPSHEEDEALRRFQEASWPRLRTARGTQASAPFERVSLLRQVAGVSPIFPLHAYRAGFARLLAGQYDAAIDEFARVAAGDALTAGSGVADYASALRRGQLPAAIEGLEKLASERDRRVSRGSPSRSRRRVLGGRPVRPERRAAERSDPAGAAGRASAPRPGRRPGRGRQVLPKPNRRSHRRSRPSPIPGRLTSASASCTCRSRSFRRPCANWKQPPRSIRW